MQSWREGGDALAPNIDADNIEQTRWANGAPISTYQDNGTWAVSAASAKHRWSFVGDLARVEVRCRGAGESGGRLLLPLPLPHLVVPVWCCAGQGTGGAPTV